jgi:hypothetical protein
VALCYGTSNGRRSAAAASDPVVRRLRDDQRQLLGAGRLGDLGARVELDPLDGLAGRAAGLAFLGSNRLAAAIALVVAGFMAVFVHREMQGSLEER